MYHAGYTTTGEADLNRALWSLAPAWTGDARSLAHQALYQTGLAGPTVHVDLLEHAIILAQEALQEAAHEPPPEPPQRTRIVIPDDRMQAGRLNKVLAQQYNFSGRGVCTLGQRLQELDLVRRTWHVHRYARHKRDGCYAELKTPRVAYSVWYITPDGHESGYDVPKIVYDALVDVPKVDGLGNPQGEPS